LASARSVLPVLAIGIIVLTGSQNAYGQFAGLQIESKTVVYTAGSAGNSTLFETKISGNSSFVVLTVLIETNSSIGSIDIAEWKVYDQLGNPFAYDIREDLPSESAAIAGANILPLGAPEGGGIGTVFDTKGLQGNDQVKVTFIYIVNAGGDVSATVLTGTRLPLHVTENSQIMADNTGIVVSDSFVNPELHCELCTAVQSLDPGKATYPVNATDLTGATEFVFWAMGAEGGESVTFNVAGREQDGGVSYINSTAVTLGSDWRMYRVDLGDADLRGITQLFGFETVGEQAFYVKGAAYN
jgi:hypothetical protein